MSILKNTLLFVSIFLIVTVATIISFGIYQTNQTPPAKKTLLPASHFSLAKAPSDSLPGTIINLTGKVSWESRTATQAAQITTTYPTIEQGELLTTDKNGETTVNFPTIGSVLIYPKTTLSFIQTLPLNFVVEQPKGEALYTKTGTVPISVRSMHLLINQDSGIMDVFVDKDLERIKISVEKGTATVAYNDPDLVSHVETIEQDTVYVFDDDTRTSIELPYAH